MPTPPTGTVTFLFTDVEGSTRLWEEHPHDMAEALARHDGLLRRTIESHHGYVFTTAGDAFAAAFADPAGACEAAIAAQRELNREDWARLGPLRVRMALHTGVADERDGDYFGPALNRCAGMLGVAHGEQVLLSSSTERLVAHRLTDGAGLNDLGEHYLRDLAEPRRLFQLTHPALRDDFPPLQSIADHPGNLPVQLSSFVGRQPELSDVVKGLDGTRLLTLTGVGGSGKTRLALEAATEARADYRRGAWLVELAPVGDPDLIIHAIGDALGVASVGAHGRNVRDVLVGFLQDQHLLLVLDNCEHLIGAVAHLVTDLLRACPQLTVLATSREGLGVPGELIWHVPSLSLPEDDGEPLESDAVQLFVQRAAATNRAFSVDGQSLVSIAQICRRLDGMPLAIELAAGRSRALTPAQISERLDDRFRILTGGKRTALSRHQTLAATVDWSYELLTAAEQLLFQRLAVFRGGFALEMAERVGSSGPIDEPSVLDLLSQLVDKSMVVTDEAAGRFDMLETLRQYALDKLVASGEGDVVRLRHLQTMADLLETTTPRLRSPDELEVLRRLANDHDNLRSALAFGLESGHETIASELVVPAAGFWLAGGHHADGYEWTSRAAAVADHVDDLALRSEVLGWAAFYAFTWEENEESRIHGERAAALATEAEDRRAMGIVELTTAWRHNGQDDLDGAATHAYRAIELARAVGDPWLTVSVAQILTNIERSRLNLAEAAQAAEEAESVARAIGAPTILAWSLCHRSTLLRYLGDYQGEIASADEAYEVFESIGNQSGMSFSLLCGAISKSELGDHAGARQNVERAEQLERDRPTPGGTMEMAALRSLVHHRAGESSAATASIRRGLAEWSDGDGTFLLSKLADLLQLIAVEVGEHAAAAQLEGWTLRTNQNAGRPRPPQDVPYHEAASRSQIANLGEERYAELHAAGASMSTAEAAAAADDLAARVQLALASA